MGWENESNWNVLHLMMDYLKKNPEEYSNPVAKNALKILNGAIHLERPIILILSENRFPDEIVNFIMNVGQVNVNEQFCWGHTAMHLVSRKGNLEFAKIILKRGADINVKNAKGQTPLMFASYAGRFTTRDFLLENGADPNLTDYKNRKASEYENAN